MPRPSRKCKQRFPGPCMFVTSTRLFSSLTPTQFLQSYPELTKARGTSSMWLIKKHWMQTNLGVLVPLNHYSCFLSSYTLDLQSPKAGISNFQPRVTGSRSIQWLECSTVFGNRDFLAWALSSAVLQLGGREKQQYSGSTVSHLRSSLPGNVANC